MNAKRQQAVRKDAEFGVLCTHEIGIQRNGVPIICAKDRCARHGYVEEPFCVRCERPGSRCGCRTPEWKHTGRRS